MSFNRNKIIDVHCHLFNLKYLPIWGVLASRGVPTKTSKFIELILLKITKESFKSNQHSFVGFSEMDLMNYPQTFAQYSDEELIDMVVSYAENERSIIEHPLLIDAANEHQEFFINETNSNFVETVSKEAKRNFIRWVVNKVLQGFAYLRWFLFMTKKESKLIKSMFETYSSVDKFAFHMMDTEHFFPGKGDFSAKPKLEIDKQIQNMSKLITKYPDRLKGFVAYNPKRVNGLKIVRDALKNGFTGVKFYPPLGYKPIDSLELFKYCAGEGIPIFTHCTPSGFQVNDGDGKNADPENWSFVLEKIKNLKLCLGHAGGIDGWFGPFDPANIFPAQTYAKKVVDLCCTYENVYCEVGFLDEVETSSQLDNFVKRLQYLFNDKSKLYDFKKKIMYGSDWHVLMNHKGGLFKDYADIFIQLLNRHEFSEFEGIKEQFFYENAENYMKRTILKT